MKGLHFLVASLLLSAFDNCAAQINADSLRLLAESRDRPDAERMDACLSLAAHFSNKDFDQTLAFTSRGKELAARLHDTLALGKLAELEGVAHYFKGQYPQAATLYYKSIRFLEKQPDPKPLAYALNDLAKLYRKTRDLDNALKLYNRALAIFQAIPDSSGIQMILNESGVVYEYKEDYPEAIRHYEASLEIARARHDQVGISYALSFIAGVYVIEQKFEPAEQYLRQALEIRQALHDSFAIALTQSDLGSLYASKGEFEKATRQLILSNTAAEQMKYPELQSNNYQQLSEIAGKQGNYAAALDYFKKYASIRDSLFSVENTRQINELNTRYETEKKEQQILLQKSELSRKNIAIAGISSLLLLSGLLGFSLYRRYQLKQKAEIQAAIMLQQDLAARAILEAEEKERQRIAKDLHDGVGQIMSAAKMNLSSIEQELKFAAPDQKAKFEKIIHLVDESCREVRSVSHNMMPDVLLRSGLAAAVQSFLDKLDPGMLQVDFYAEGLQGRMEPAVETVLYRVIQECVNNVIRHAGATHLDISLIRDTDGISATVEDNGRGFNIADPEATAGMGLKNIRTRIEYLKGQVEFDSQPGRGTLVAMHVPLKES